VYEYNFPFPYVVSQLVSQLFGFPIFNSHMCHLIVCFQLKTCTLCRFKIIIFLSLAFRMLGSLQ